MQTDVPNSISTAGNSLTSAASNLSQDELKHNEELLEYFLANYLYDTEEVAERRRRIVARLTAMLKAWAVSMGTAKGIQEELLVDGGGIQIQVFGSTRLEVQNYDTDMDLLVIAPYYITKSDFFTSFSDTLTTCPEVDNLLSIPEAYTPVLKFVIMGLSVDVIFTSLQIPKLNPTVDVLDLRCLKGLDEQSVRSLNGVRVAEWIYKLVPNMINYRTTLRAVKHWARQRGLYSNVLGFLGGVQFALLVAAVCQQFPHASPFTLLQKFFAMYASWMWPCPVILRRYEDLQFKDSDGNYFPVWNPVVNFKDSLHLMPIITPAYPAMNSAYNISQPQFRCIHEELCRADQIFQNHKLGSPFPWAKLFESSTEEFFQTYPRYIQIDISAPTETDHRIWFGWVESRIRLLILSLEQPPTVYCHPIANCWHRQPVKSQAENLPIQPANSPSPLTASSESSDNTENVLESTAAATTNGIVADRVHSPENPALIIANSALTFVTPQKAQSQNGNATDFGDDVFVSSFFLGLSFGTAQLRVDVTPQIMDFTMKVNNWKNKTADMALSIKSFEHGNVPSFIHNTKAEPSNMKSCTPKVTKLGESKSMSHDNMVDDHNRLVHPHLNTNPSQSTLHSLTMSKSDSLHSHHTNVVSFEAGDDNDEAGPARPNGVHYIPTEQTIPTNHPAPPMVNGIPIVPVERTYSDRKFQSGRMNNNNNRRNFNRAHSGSNSAFENYRYDNSNNDPAAYHHVSSPQHNNYHQKGLASPKNPRMNQNKQPFSPKSPNGRNLPVDQFPYVVPNAPLTPGSQQRQMRNNNNNGNGHKNGFNDSNRRRPSTGNYSTSSDASDRSNTVPSTLTNGVSLVHPSQNVVAAPAELPPLTFGSLPPAAPFFPPSPTYAKTQSVLTQIAPTEKSNNVYAMQEGYGYDVNVPGPVGSPARNYFPPEDRVNQKRSRNELMAASSGSNDQL